ncbi:hypothetical protein O6H91_05G089900 [Diphasiastrum complanatum]|nr:hypothetical protein O6H91_05G089900 [Diphasiastrum complanatum]
MPPIQSMAMDAPDVGYGGPTLSVQVWPSIGGPVMPFVPNMGPGLNGGPIPSQFEQHNHPHLQAAHQMHGPQSPHMFARPLPPHGPGFQPGGPPLGVPFGFGGSPSLGPGPGAGIQPLFMADGNGHLGGPDRPKKAAVPSWLREELLKKRAAAALGGLTSSAYPDELVQANGDEASVTPIRKSNRKTESSGLSDSEEEKDEDEVEAARTTAINQEIKRVLTEVLLKVTDSLFDEIAQEVLGEEAAEDDYVPLQAQDPQADPANQGKRSVSVEPVGQGSVVRAAASPPPPEAPTPFAPTRVLVAPVKKSEQSGREDSESLTSNTPAGNVLGLANYASDDENDVQSGRESSAVKLEKHVEDAKDGRLSKIRRVDDVTEKKQEKVIETQRSLKEMEKTSGKEIGEESENWHKFERVKGRESDREREDRKEDRKEKDKERGRERERKENKERNEQKQWKERNRVNEAGNPHEQDGRSLRKPQPVEAEKPRASGQSEARGVEDTEFISRQSKIRSSHSRTVEVREQKHIQGVGEASGDKSLEPQDPSGHAEGFIPNTRSLPQGQSITEARLDRHNRGDRVRGADANMLDKFAKEGKVDIPEKGTMNSKRVFEKVSSLSDHPKTDGSRTEELEKLDKTRAREKAGGKSRDKESEKLHEKDKSKHENRMSDIGKAKDKAKDKKSQEADRRHNERGRADISREKKNENRDAKRSRRRSTSASGRGRSRSRSTSSRSLSSSLSPSRDDSPKRRKLHVGRSSKRRSISRSPIRSRSTMMCISRRSRSRSRSPRSKHSHRRVSPSPSRERDRHKRSRSGSPVRRRRRS